MSWVLNGKGGRNRFLFIIIYPFSLFPHKLLNFFWLTWVLMIAHKIVLVRLFSKLKTKPGHECVGPEVWQPCCTFVRWLTHLCTQIVSLNTGTLQTYFKSIFSSKAKRRICLPPASPAILTAPFVHGHPWSEHQLEAFSQTLTSPSFSSFVFSGLHGLGKWACLLFCQTDESHFLCPKHVFV